MYKRTLVSRWRLGATGVFGLLCLTTPAQATTYCVPDASGCAGTAVATVQAALNMAEDPGNDVVRIKPGSYTGSFHYTAGEFSGTLEVKGNAPGVTLQSTSSAGATLTLIPNVTSEPYTKVSNLLIKTTAGGFALATYGDVEDVTIESGSGAQGATGLNLTGDSVARRVDIRMADNGSPENRGVRLLPSTGDSAGPAEIVDSSIDAHQGIYAANGLSLKRSRLVTEAFGLEAHCAGSVGIDSVIHTVAGNPSAYGFLTESKSACGATPSILDIRHLSLVSENPASGPALRTLAGQGGEARITMRSSIVRGFDSVVQRELLDTGMGSDADIEVDHSLVDLARIHAPSAGGATDLGANSVADPLFLDGPARDYRLAWPSPAIDAGHPTPLGASDSPTDLLGAERLLDGNGDGIARRDAGAFEYYGPAPKLSVTPDPAVVGQPVTFDASQTAHPISPIFFFWTWDDGGSAGSFETVTHTFSTPGTHTGSVMVNDSAAQVANLPFSVRVNAAPVGEQTAGPSAPSGPPTPSNSSGPGTSSADTTAPTLTARLLKKRFGRRKGGALEIKLNEAATVSVIVERCTKRKGRRCTRYRRASSKTVKSPAGTSRVALQGLRTGLHRVRVRATDAAGNPSAERTAAFTVTR